MTLDRRNLLSLGALTLLTGCDLSTHSGVDAALWAMLGFNDRVQAALFNPHRLAGRRKNANRGRKQIRV